MVPRYRTLDAMRGFAAIAVLFLHSHAVFGVQCTVQWTCQPRFGYLAVDLFFALSGFVLAHSYDPKFAKGMTAGRFMIARVIRLAPLYWLALAIGGVLLLWTAAKQGLHQRETIITIAGNAFLLPVPIMSGWPFPAVPPAWSLFYELWVANLVFAVCWPAIKGGTLYAVIIVALCSLVLVSWQFGSLSVGDQWTNFVGGAPRVVFSFFLGVALYRWRIARIAPSLPAWIILTVLLASLTMPLSGKAAQVYELLAVVLIFPALIYLGAGAIERRPQLGKVLGDISYALYLLHFPILLSTVRFIAKGALHPGMVLGLAFTAICILAAWMADGIFDKHARRLLGKTLRALAP
jgi:peptidoglycan/LPS O-acetylase OafA/YrhL